MRPRASTALHQLTTSDTGQFAEGGDTWQDAINSDDSCSDSDSIPWESLTIDNSSGNDDFDILQQLAGNDSASSYTDDHPSPDDIADELLQVAGSLSAFSSGKPPYKGQKKKYTRGEYTQAFKTQVAALSQHDTSASKKSLPFAVIADLVPCRHGANCKYSHDPALLSKVKQTLYDKAKTLHTSNKSANLPSASIPKAAHQAFMLDGILGLIADKSSLLTAVHVRGTIPLLDSIISVVVLLDSGCSIDDLISSQCYEEHKNLLSSYYTPSNRSLLLGDGKSIVTISGTLLLPLHITYDNVRYTSEVKLGVYKSTSISQDIIIGLPSLSTVFYDLFMSVMHKCHLEHLNKSSLNVLEIDWPRDLNDTQPPFQDIKASSVEEVFQPDLGSFRHVLHYLTMPYDDALQEYFSLFDTHISPILRDSTDIVNFMKSDVAIAVFCPPTWKGIKMDPVEFDWKDALPASLKPPPIRVSTDKLEAYTAYDVIFMGSLY